LGRLPQTDLCDAVLRFLRKTHTLHREMSTTRSLPRKQQFSEYSLASG
jgi:hypothetical protein